MSHDIVIRGGKIVDGTGAAPFHGDVGIKDGRIAEIGKIAAKGTEEIDAEGHVVSPGFIDLHTHLDAQIGWDPDLTPISWHGVTTALMGNCGVTFAPCKPKDREFLAAMMESVEDIPRQAIMTGLPWTWEEYGDYLNSIEALKPGLNVAGLVGHSAVRYYVMGERSFEDQASDAEKKQMAEIVGRALDAGAVGFSTNRFAPHKAPDGRSIPGTFADPSELIEIGKAVTKRNGLMQAVGATGDVLKAIADQSKSRVLFSYGVGSDKGAGLKSAEGLDRLAEGRDLTAICQVKGTGFMFGMQCSLPFRGKAWEKVRAMDLKGRVATIKDPELRATLIAEGKTGIPLEHTYYIGDAETPNLTAPRNASVRDDIAKTGESFVEYFLRLSRETDGRALFNFRLFCQDMDELGDLFRSTKNVLPSLGDAGAHVSQIIDADWATFTLKYWIKERGVYSLEEGIKRMTSDGARVMGLKDRGTLKVGRRADVNVFDMDRVTQLQPHIVHNFPGGAPHFTMRARGYKATLVNGKVNVRDDQSTGARAGMVLRHGR
ncbi:MAG: amidohydrolase family protein [Alphaproteobacteria bacterium]|nr:amidohydrolase family protein [Alphaproteobacteria bacterium]MBL6939257.1 amidohydrolase family protein [Alphaproteobacteria bacterium]MBL7096773.1 amidohydrolase family protein [Alphaproteobacteria bacterium]